jgi:hypothetical protein
MQLLFKKSPLYPEINSLRVIMIKLCVLQLPYFKNNTRKYYARY